MLSYCINAYRELLAFAGKTDRKLWEVTQVFAIERGEPLEETYTRRRR